MNPWWLYIYSAVHSYLGEGIPIGENDEESEDEEYIVGSSTEVSSRLHTIKEEEDMNPRDDDGIEELHAKTNDREGEQSQEGTLDYRLYIDCIDRHEVCRRNKDFLSFCFESEMTSTSLEVLWNWIKEIGITRLKILHLKGMAHICTVIHSLRYYTSILILSLHITIHCRWFE